MEFIEPYHTRRGKKGRGISYIDYAKSRRRFSLSLKQTMHCNDIAEELVKEAQSNVSKKIFEDPFLEKNRRPGGEEMMDLIYSRILVAFRQRVAAMTRW